MRQRSRLPVALLVALFALACAVNPVTGRRELVLMSPQEEAQAGRQAAAQVEQEMGLVRMPALGAYVSAIGERLARHSPRQDVKYQFAVADMEEPNAFALPGGYVYVSRGLLELTNSEAELANVIGHEIGHVAARHAAQRQTQSIGASLLTVLGAVAAGVYGGAPAAQAVGSLGQLASAGYIASYSRDQERQADEIGQKLAAESGWDPSAMATFLRTLERYSALKEPGASRRPTFLDSHPLTAERVQTASARAATLPVQAAVPIAGSRGAFLKRIAGVMVGPDPRQGVFRGSRFIQPVLGFRLDFPPGWATQNTPQAVAAASPRRDASIVLEGQGPAGDPAVAAQRFAAQAGVQLQDAAPLRIGDLAAYHAVAAAQGQNGAVGADLTWISLGAGTYRITGVTPLSLFSSYAATFRQVAQSFRRATADDLEGVQALRLAVVQAQPGETLASLSRRSGNDWSLAETAAANALPAEVRFSGGEWVKIARPGSLLEP